MTPTTDAGRVHDADWRNLLRIARAAVEEYGATPGRVFPAIEMLNRALQLLAAVGDVPSVAIECEAAADERARLRAAVEKLPSTMTKGLLDGEPFRNEFVLLAAVLALLAEPKP